MGSALPSIEVINRISRMSKVGPDADNFIRVAVTSVCVAGGPALRNCEAAAYPLCRCCVGTPVDSVGCEL
jgi:hypothetical protein